MNIVFSPPPRTVFGHLVGDLESTSIAEYDDVIFLAPVENRLFLIVIHNHGYQIFFDPESLDRVFPVKLVKRKPYVAASQGSPDEFILFIKMRPFDFGYVGEILEEFPSLGQEKRKCPTCPGQFFSGFKKSLIVAVG